jgi:excisionase family DNA binding protein
LLSPGLTDDSEGTPLMNQGSEVFGIREVAAFLGAHDQTIRRLARRGAIPAFKVGKDWRFHKEALLRWVEEQSESARKRAVVAGGSTPFAKSSCSEVDEKMTSASVGLDKRYSVLVIDDDERVCAGLARIVEQFGYRVRQALSGSKGLELVAEDAPDLILLDLMMPGMTGPKFLQKLRVTHPDLLVVIVTAYEDSDLVHDAKQFAPLMVLSKPVNQELLERTMRVALRKGTEARVA